MYSTQLNKLKDFSNLRNLKLFTHGISLKLLNFTVLQCTTIFYYHFLWQRNVVKRNYQMALFQKHVEESYTIT